MPLSGILNTATSQQYNNLLNFPPAIFLRNNSLTGTIPIEIGRLKFVHVLDFKCNYSCRYLTAVRLAYNEPQGQISPEIVMMTPLSFLSLSGNNLSYMTGAIRILTGCKNLIVLILSSNFMNEAMPNYDLKKISDVLQNLQAPDCGG